MCHDAGWRTASALRIGVSISASLLALGLLAGLLPNAGRASGALLHAGLVAAILTPGARLAAAAHGEWRAANRSSLAGAALTALALIAAIALALAPRLIR